MHAISMPDLYKKWVAVINSILVGWNVGLLTSFLFAITLGIVARNIVGPMKESAGIVIVLAVSIVVGATVGFIMAKKLFGWFAQRTTPRGYVWLVVLVAITVLSFPAPFNYSISYG